MTTEELEAIILPYVGRRCRIASDTSGIAWKIGQWPTLTEVKLHNEAVWLHDDTGAWWEVRLEGLTIELEPCLGSFDFSAKADLLEAIGTAMRRFGPTPADRRKSCNCASCSATRDSLESDKETAWKRLEVERDAVPKAEGGPREGRENNEPREEPREQPKLDPRPEDDKGPLGGPDLSGF